MHISSSVLTGVVALSSSANAALTKVDNFGSNPTSLQMNINVPSKLADKPAIILAMHGCMSTGETYASSTKYISSPKPEASSPSSLYEERQQLLGSQYIEGPLRDAGGDNQGLVNMIKYTIQKYNADPTKVFATGSSSGCMMTNVLMATYPDVIAAGSCYSGVAAGCLAGSPGASPTSADPTCANGQIIKTQDQWVAQAKAMYPGYNGTYPRMQTWHGTADTLVKLPNLGEQLKEWSGLHKVAFSKNVTNTPQSGYTQIVYGDGTKLVGYQAQGGTHGAGA